MMPPIPSTSGSPLIEGSYEVIGSSLIKDKKKKKKKEHKRVEEQERQSLKGEG